ncbi:hypothetical protein PHYSODRAFT_326944 [Phytophthora sojae]|uniref:Uncharacterized protein n=1 Tax=Phytophthora sojae (strain P6497) TaxID=1094619 RepID=G4YUS2_PHYSP|nr:hypothetical protein PHYSODRAFT_326938 [Phytophthora sojae]XP_009521285.1 hypothetical protein PHYSODRAFT_326944 [Phytophthora sojae]EGZ25991.1 hypothetical protein PHYSODRAFT_326938 [Phytophthora sojae]EGZ25997.1 hypothetical protein PHYSODRAFT_326944 [Phytophthora sojae]|eukprot:XP_009521279.1 hypothetical protein PHYSODRAFT_326938 [Phytophthora sojae]
MGDRFNRFFFAHMTLIGVYPIYKVLYSFVPSSYRSVVFVAFSVDFFGTLFVSVCMYTSGSLYLSGLFIVADVGQSLLEFREIHANAQLLMGSLQDRRASEIRLRTKSSRRISMLDTYSELLTTMTAVVQDPTNYEANSLQRARVYWALVKYVDCVVPLVFAVYKFTLVHLPNAQYYPESDTQWGGSAFSNLVVFGLLEVVIFVVFNVFSQTRFSFSALYQLAFVLERQLCPVQVHLFVALLLLLQYELYHFGADFTLEFEWLKDTQQ